jgi:guanylate kinase
VSEREPPRAVVLYGPPAVGKDTITAALASVSDRYRLFPRLKAGPGRTAGYRMVAIDQLEALRRAGEILWENERYGAVYAVDRPELVAMLEHDQVPVLHLGQAAAVTVVTGAVLDVQWLVVSLTCPRSIAEGRIVQRDTGDTAARLAAYDATESLPDPDLTIDTSSVSPHCAAGKIHTAVRATSK